MKQGRRILLILLVVILAGLLLSGCWDRKELEQRTSVVAMAIDLVQKADGGKQQLVRVSVQIPIPIKIMGAGGGSAGEGGKSAVKVMSATGVSMVDAMNRLQVRLNQELFYGHTRVIAISEDLARDNMAGIVDSLRRSPQMRRLLWIVITPGDAINLLNADPKLEQIPIVYVMDLIENGAEQGRYPDLTLGRWFIDRSSAGSQPMANLIESSKQEVKWHGIALFDDDKMVGHIDENESWVLLQAKEHQIGGNVTIPCPNNSKEAGQTIKTYISVHPKKVHVKTKVEPYGKTFKMTINIQVENDVIESMCGLDFTKEETFHTLEKALQEEMNNRARKLVEDVQQKYRVDVFGMGNKVRAKYMQQFEQMQWNKEFPNAKIAINYQVQIRRVGMKMQ